jgi:hypothetical protein
MIDPNNPTDTAKARAPYFTLWVVSQLSFTSLQDLNHGLVGRAAEHFRNAGLHACMGRFPI